MVDILRIAGLPELAEEACRVLPDPVEYNHAARFLAQHSITKGELISCRGGNQSSLVRGTGRGERSSAEYASWILKVQIMPTVGTATGEIIRIV